MAITILDTILDEEFRATQSGTADDNDASLATFGASAAKTAIDALSLNVATGYPGFPQHAEKVNFVSSTNAAVTDYFLTSNSSGDPFPAAGVATDLYVGSDRVYLFATSDPNIVVGRIGNGADADPAGEVALTICIEETVAGGVVTSADMWTSLFAPLTHDGEDLVDADDVLDLTGLIYIGSDFDTTTEVPFSDFSDVPSGNNTFNVIFPTGTSTDLQLLVTGSAGETLGTVNVSTQGIGANSQHVAKGATLRIDMVKGMTQANVDDPPEVNNSGNIDYTDRVDLIAANFEITQTNANGKPADLRIDAFQVAGTSQEAAYLTNAIATDGAPVVIDAADVRILNAAGVDITATWDARAGTSITQSGNGVIVTGLLEGDRIAFTTDGEEFDRFLVTNVDTKETFDVGNINVTSIQGGEDTEFEELGSHLMFQDDGPLIERNSETVPELAVDDDDLSTDDTDDFSGLFDEDEGADATASVAYTLDVTLDGTDAPDSGLDDTGTGNSIFLFLESGEVVGREGTDATDAITGDEVFRVSADSSGNVTLDQSRAVAHSDSNDHNSSTSMTTANLIQLVATISDSEADATDDSASATADIADSFLFFDDGPDIDETSGEDLRVDNTVGNDSDSGDFDVDGNNDPNAHVTIVGAPDTDGFAFTYDDSNNNSITGTLGGTELYTLSIDDDGTYLFTLTGELPATPDALDVTDIKAGGPNTNFITVGTLNSNDHVKLSGFDTNGSPAAINESNANVGVKNGNLDVGESIKFELFAPDGADAGTDPDPIYFLGLNIGTKSAKASDYLVSIDFVDPTVTDIVDMAVHVDKNTALMINPTGDDLIQSITVEKQTGSALKLGLGDISILRPPGDYELNFDVRQTDGDDDFDQASFAVEIDGNGDTFITNPVII